MITTYRIIISILTIIVVTTATAGTTYAFFTSSQTFAGNIISTGSLTFVSTLTDIFGTPINSIMEQNFAPGLKSTRCLFVKNNGTLSGRFKIYRKQHSGDINILGNALQVTGTLNPTTGACSTVLPVGLTANTKHQLSQVSSTVAMTDQSFGSLATTPFKIDKSANPILSEHFVVYRLEISLPNNITIGGQSAYNVDFEIFGIQAEGSDGSADW